MTWTIKKVNRIPTHCGVAYESVHSLSRGHVIIVWPVQSSNLKRSLMNMIDKYHDSQEIVVIDNHHNSSWMAVHSFDW